MKKLFSKAENRIFLLFLIDSALCGVMSWRYDITNDFFETRSDHSIALKLIFFLFDGLYELLSSVIVSLLIQATLLTLFLAIVSRIVYRQDGSLFAAYKTMVEIENGIFISIAIILFIIELPRLFFQPWRAFAGLLVGIIMIASQVRINIMMKEDIGY